jgi:outer membrane protein assembly factor BamB
MARMLTLLVILTGISRSHAQDWLQWGGPNGDFTVSAPALAEKWPAGGPKQLWRRMLGDGYSCILFKAAESAGVDSPAAGASASPPGRLFTEYRVNDDAFIIALDAINGQTVWEHRYTPALWPEMDKGFGLGPNATPLIVGDATLSDRIISISIDGHVRCLDLSSGELLWEHDLPAEFGRRKRVEEYGYSASPLPYKGMVIVQVGGDHHSVIALRPRDGSIAWKGEPGGVSYAAATITRLAGQDQYVYFEPEGVVGLDPATGRVLWRSAIEFNNGNHLTPIVKCEGDRIWVGSQFPTGGGRLLEITASKGAMAARQIWFDAKLRASHWTNIRLGDFIYGSVGDNRVSFLAAFDWRTGKIAWRERGFHKAQSLYADGKLLWLDENGQLAMARPSPEGLRLLDKAQVTECVSWTLPTLVSSTLYVRDRKHVLALDLGRGGG